MRVKRPKISVRGAMLAVLLAALAFGITERTARIAKMRRVMSQYRQEIDRLEWTRSMSEKGYLSKADLEAQKVVVQKAGLALDDLE
jgi:hypothetical protein